MIDGGKIRLREEQLADARDDYMWQTDPELVELDAASLLTLTFTQYLASYASELRYSHTGGQRFAIDTLEGKHIGNCAYYGVDEDKAEAELGIMIGDRDYWDNGYGSDAVATLVNYVFRQTKMDRIHLKTLDWNKRAQKCFEKCGFSPYKQAVVDRHNFVFMELHRDQWKKRQTESEPATRMDGDTRRRFKIKNSK